MRLSAFLRVTTQSFLLRTAVALYRRRIRFQSGPLYPVFSPESELAPQLRRHCLGRLAARLLHGLIRLSLALTGLRLRLQQPEISHRFRGCQSPVLFRFGTLGRPRVGSGLAAPPYPTGCGSQAMFL